MDPRRLLSAARLAPAFVLALALAAEGQAATPARVGKPPSDLAPSPAPASPPPVARGPAAIRAANIAATARSRADRFVGGLQVFPYAPGRIYEVWTAPLRVTSLTLGPGESVVALAAGDTVRWQIGETASGTGDGRRAHVLVKPLARGLETNLVLTTSLRLYMLRLRSAGPEDFNPAVAWVADTPAPGPAPAPSPPGPPPAAAPAAPDADVTARLDARYRIAVTGRRPAWTPTAVMTDGTRTLIAFPPALAQGEAPALFALGPDGRAQMINYRQQPGLYIVDRVLDRAELRLGKGRGAVVTLTRLDGGRP